MAAQCDVFLVEHQAAPSVDFLLCTHGRPRPNLRGFLPSVFMVKHALVSPVACTVLTQTRGPDAEVFALPRERTSLTSPKAPPPPVLLPSPLPSTSVSLVVSEPRWCRWCPSPVLAVLYKLCVVCLGLLFFSVKSWWCLTKACFQRFWAKGGGAPGLWDPCSCLVPVRFCCVVLVFRCSIIISCVSSSYGTILSKFAHETKIPLKKVLNAM